MVRTCVRAAALGLLLGLIWIAPVQAQSDAEKIRLIENEAAGWSRNMDRLMASFSEDVVYEDVPLGLVFQGKEQLRGFAQSFFDAFPDLNAVIIATVVSGDRAASEWRFTGTQTGDLMGIPGGEQEDGCPRYLDLSVRGRQDQAQGGLLGQRDGAEAVGGRAGEAVTCGTEQGRSRTYKHVQPGCAQTAILRATQTA